MHLLRAGLRHGVRGGYFEPEAGAAPRLAFHADAAAEPLYDILADGKSQPRAGYEVAELHEAVEDVLLLLPRNSRPGVGDVEAQFPPPSVRRS